MADTKITALAAITTVDPAADVLPIVDISDTSMAASGTTKKITSNQILGAGGTATLASATITGDLTVASSILKVTGGNVGINTATPTNTAGYKTLEIVGTAVNTGGMIRMKSSDASVSSYDFVDNNGRGIFAVSNHNLRFGCNDIEQYRIQPLGIFTWYDGAGGTRMTLNSTGLGVGVTPSAGRGAIQLSAGVGFPATQVASSDANTLDDYEEGTFTPTIIGTSTAGTGTYSVQSGTYTKVGRLVSCQIFLDWTAHTGTGDMRISGLPFQVSSASNYFAAAAIGYFSNVSLSAGNIATGYAINATSVITLGQYPTGGGAGAGIAMDTSGEILISVTYIV
jgi:hypothetical protein